MEAMDLSYYQRFFAALKNVVLVYSLDVQRVLVEVDMKAKLMTKMTMMMTPKTLTVHLNEVVWMAFDLKTILREHVPL